MALAILTFIPIRADDDTPVPPEIQALAEALVSALKSGDDNAVILHRASSIRAFTTKNLGNLAALKLTKVELDPDGKPPADQPSYDDGDHHLTTTDDTWKFKDRLEERIAIILPDTPD